MGCSKTNAKTVASERALDRLRQTCWTIRVKQAVDSDETGIDREEVMGELQKQTLRKMGWTGGGVGAEGNKGKAEPVAVSMAAHTVIRREGLGLSSNQTMVDFKKKVKEVIENYAKSEKQEDLAFAPCFSKEERAFIHQQCMRLNLKSQSRGTGNERYLTVSRKRTSSQLFDHLMQEGGSTSKYELVPPLYENDS
ncbi:hypothetical protein FSP39_020872 [Pinctada imbricata]|uniref:NF-kappa-B-repressing factor n=1 Tax=Pinctada imbricata TaxID=66713 RepID=A0AA88YLG9_PINIB|nr:hypothetical protein FSP39_020872 [Pinctada imbricata]